MKNPDYTIIENVAYDYIEFNADLENIIESADCICFGTLALTKHGFAPDPAAFAL